MNRRRYKGPTAEGASARDGESVRELLSHYDNDPTHAAYHAPANISAGI